MAHTEHVTLVIKFSDKSSSFKRVNNTRVLFEFTINKMKMEKTGNRYSNPVSQFSMEGDKQAETGSPLDAFH